MLSPNLKPLTDTLSLLNLSYVKRWVIAPMLREQSVAEHTFRVMVITESLMIELASTSTPFTPVEMTMCFREAMFHDQDEIETGDVPGTQKSKEIGYLKPLPEVKYKTALIKVADSIETGTFGLQWGCFGNWAHPGNVCPARDIQKIEHYAAKIPGLYEAAAKVWEQIVGKRMPKYAEYK